MRLIDADLLKSKVPNTNVDIFENCRNCSTLMDWQVKELIDDAPTIDAVDVKHGEWIPCSERLPSKKEIVLITNSKGNVRCGQFRGTYEKYWTWKGNTLETVVAWMPLPEPWKGAERC